MNMQTRKQARLHQGVRTLKRQAGLTLMETMISLALSLIVTTAMVILMGNSMGSATRLIHMTQLTDELRDTMSMMTRDVRRANYSANSIFCFGYSKCGTIGSARQAGDITVNGQCFTFTLDRKFDGDATNDAAGGFRLDDRNGTGVVQMWTGGDGVAPTCNDHAAWIDLTDPSVVNVTNLDIDDSGSITTEFSESETATYNSRQREIALTLEGQLVLEDARGNNVVERRIQDIIHVRNDYVTPNPTI